jgi:hypothetical protein
MPAGVELLLVVVDVPEPPPPQAGHTVTSRASVANEVSLLTRAVFSAPLTQKLKSVNPIEGRNRYFWHFRDADGKKYLTMQRHGNAPVAGLVTGLDFVSRCLFSGGCEFLRFLVGDGPFGPTGNIPHEPLSPPTCPAVTQFHNQYSFQQSGLEWVKG